MQIKSEIDDLNIFLITKSGELKFKKCVPILYVSTDITIPLLLSKKTSSFKLSADLFFSAIFEKTRKRYKTNGTPFLLAVRRAPEIAQPL